MTRQMLPNNTTIRRQRRGNRRKNSISPNGQYPIRYPRQSRSRKQIQTFPIDRCPRSSVDFENTAEGETGYALYDERNRFNELSSSGKEHGFTVTINPEFVPQLTPGNQLRFVYYMYLNEQAMPINGFKNEANVETDFMTDQTPPSVEILTGANAS